ncbi:sn-glycerol-3-phosphate ABC transporter substrate-binding protein UgpB [Pararhodobacter sp. CCB-MM2]|uniref:sn-glycerol-3-phosphate ABC transporter substrate-binding protein UgpB n=1 Tax=Pararhodobacter sp. CCB-MM2 TaxID=1786003 RepID=UPI00082BFD51|nr:sn-glycerol-3-phosphate ABC transporter substrate-binding protein UgpB [Pararhodobacter sp. CCB-MM2]MCA2013231.1 sn-glycerol-3-phosphate ABC transporter substrate-binding protein UgpB [Cereibacter sphaeroides]
MFKHSLMAATALALVSPIAAQAQTEIQWWHAMGGRLGELVEEIAANFNASQSDYVVVPSFRGTYPETMNGAIAAFRAGEQPHIVQVFEVGTGTMMGAEGAIVPVYELMENNDVAFDPEAFLPAVVGYYTDPNGNMLSFPFNSSTPILYYNRDIFEAAGLDPETPPTTWAEMEQMGTQIVESGAATCGFTTSYPSWVLLENFTAMHNISLSTQQNGFAGFDAEFNFNQHEPVIRLWNKLGEWQQSGVYAWSGGGSGPDSGTMFYSGQCAMLINSSAGRAGVLANTDFGVGYGMQPYFDDVEGAPQNSIIGGATLWTLAGHTDEEYAAVAHFFEFLSQPEQQAWWHQNTGYLPVTTAAFELTQEQGYYDENPGADISIRQMNLNPPTENSRGLRYGNFVQIRDIFSEAIESVVTGAADAQTAADDAVARGNALLRDFESAMQ